MKTAVIRLDGVLIPPIWQQIAYTTGISELTSSEMTNGVGLMQKRLLLLRHHKLTLDNLQFIVSMFAPFQGAVRFINALQQEYRVIAVSNALPELALYFTTLLGDIELYTEQYAVCKPDLSTFITADSKPNATINSALADKSSNTLVIGNTVADIGMLRLGAARFLFRPSGAITQIAPDIPVARRYQQIFQQLFLKMPISRQTQPVMRQNVVASHI